MKHWNVCVVTVLLAVLGVVVFAAEKPPENYQQAMKKLDAFRQEVPKAITAEDYDAVSKYADSAKDAFMIVEAYWSAKADSAAVKTAQDGIKAAADLGVTASLKSKEGAEYSVKIITDMCMGCHTAHRERAPDGTFQIK